MLVLKQKERERNLPAQVLRKAKTLILRIREIVSTMRKRVFTTDQISRLMMCLPESVMSLRVEIVIACFARIGDMENFYDLIDPPELTVDYWEGVVERLGWLNVFNPLKPDHHYFLDLKWADHNKLASILIQLEVKEEGDNWVDYRHRLTEAVEGSVMGGWIGGWVLPGFWVDNVPDKGQLELTYTSAAAKGCRPQWDLRKSLINECLLGTIPS